MFFCVLSDSFLSEKEEVQPSRKMNIYMPMRTERYVLSAASIRAVQKADILKDIGSLEYDEAEKRLMSIRGIGKKVASCVLLFGFHRMEAFPVDVWIRKVLEKYYPGKGLEYFEPYPALCQQYLFSYARFLKLE